MDALKKSFGDVGSRSNKTISSQKANLILKRLLGKMKGDFGKKTDGTQKSSNLRYQSSKFKDLFAKLILVEPFSNCLFGKDGCFNKIPADVISLLNTAEPLKDLAKKAREATPVQLKYLLLSLGKSLSNSLLSQGGSEPSELFISNTKIKDLLSHLGCSAQLDRLDRATCLAFLSKYHTDTHVTGASQFYAQPVLVFPNGEGGSTHSTDSNYLQKSVPGNHGEGVDQFQGDPGLYEVPVHTDDTHLATALGFSPQFFDYVSLDPTTKLHNNQIVIHPTDPGKFAVSMKSDKGRVATYPLAVDQESGSWMLLGKPLAEFLPQVVSKEENRYATVVDSQPIYANTVSEGDYSFRVSPYGDNNGLNVMYSLGGKSAVRNFSNCLDAVGFAHKLTVAADAKLPVALFEHFRPEKMGVDQRSDVVAESDYSFWLSPHQADSNETNPPKFMVTYFLGGEIKEQPCASLEAASQFSARVLKAGEIKLPPNLFQFFKLEVPQYSDISNGEMLVYPLVRPKWDIAFGLVAKALDGESAAVYEHDGTSVSNYVAWIPNQSSHADVIPMPFLAPLGDVMVFHGLKDSLVGNEECKRPDYVNLFANPNRSVSPNGSKLSTTILEAIQFGGKRVGFIASSDPLEKTNGVDFYRVVKDKEVGLIVRLNVSQGKEYFPSGEGETKTLGDATAGGVATVKTISLQEYKFSGLEKLKYDKAQYPGFDPKDLKLEVRNLLVDGTHPVIHLNLAGWPDHKAIPPEVLKVVKEFICKLVKENNIQNMLGHCKAGVGRTGTLYEALRMKDGPVNREEIAKSIEATRADRSQMVQDSVQFLSLVNFGSFSGDNPVSLVAEAVANAAPPPVPARPVKPAVNPLINQDNTIFFNGKLNLVSQHDHSGARLLILNNIKKEGNDLKNFYVLRKSARGGYALTYSIPGEVKKAILTVSACGQAPIFSDSKSVLKREDLLELERLKSAGERYPIEA